MVGPENSIFWKLKSIDRKKMPLTTEIILHFYFPFKAFPENERKREHAREEKRRTRSRRREIAPLIAISPSRDRARSRSRSMAREEDLRSRDLVCRQERKIRDRKISYVGKRGRSEIAIDASRDRAVDRDLAKKARLRSRRRSLSRIGFVVVGLDFSSLMIFFWVVACVLSLEF